VQHKAACGYVKYLQMIDILQALPESLRYLLAAGQNEKATEVLKRMATSSQRQLPDGKITASAEVRMSLSALV